MTDKKEKARQRRIATARDLEGRGHVDHAVKEYLRAKVPGEAARLLAKHGRLKDAGQAILDGLKVTIDEVGQLSANDRALVEQVVLFFEHGHAAGKAEQLKAALAGAPPPDPAAEDRALSAEAAPEAKKKPERISKPAPQPVAEKKEPPAPVRREVKKEPPAPVGRQVKKLPDAGSFVPSQRPPAPARSATTSGSFRPPSRTTTSSSGFRAPSSGSFRPPGPSAGSLRAPSRPPEAAPKAERPARPSPSPAVISGQPSRPSLESSAKTPRASAISTGSFARPSATKPVEGARSRPVITTGSFEVPRLDSSEAKPARSTPSPATAPKAEPSRPVKRKPRASDPQLSASGEVITEYAGKREQGWRGAGQEALEKSIEEHLAAGRKGAAARIAREAGQYDRALAWFEELGLHHQAGACLRAIGRYDDALVMLMKQDVKSPNYRKACFELVAVAKELGTTLDFTYDRFLTRFIEQGPADRDEISTYLDLAHLYLANEFTGGAKRCLRKILASDPEHVAAKELGATLRRTARESAAEAPRAVGLPASARGLPPLPSLEEFVELAQKHAPQE